MKLTLSFLFFLTYLASAGQGPVKYSLSYGGPSREQCFSSATDTEGNLYILGDYYEQCDFDPSAEDHTLTSAGSSDLFIQKLDSNGSLVWVITLSSINSDFGAKLNIDSENNLIVTASVIDSTKWISPNQTKWISGDMDTRVFILKANPEGIIEWYKTFGDPGSSMGISDATLDNDDNIIISGSFTSSVDMDPNSDDFNIDALLTSTSKSDAYMCKYNEDGEFLWLKSWGGELSDWLLKVRTDKDNNLLGILNFKGLVDLDPSFDKVLKVNSRGSSDLCLVKLNEDGDFQWAKTFGTQTHENQGDLALDQNGNVFITGNFSGKFYVGQDSSNAMQSTGYGSSFIIKFDSSGETGWIKSVATTGLSSGECITTDYYRNVFISGYFTDTVEFDSSSKFIASDKDLYLMKIDSNGNTSNVTVIGGPDDEIGTLLQVDNDNQLYLVTSFTDSLLLQRNGSDTAFFSNGSKDISIIKFGQKRSPSIKNTTSNRIQNVQVLQIKPNPVLNHLTVNGLLNEAFSIYNISGQEVLTGNLANGSVNVQTLIGGVYYIKITQKNSLRIGKWVKL